MAVHGAARRHYVGWPTRLSRRLSVETRCKVCPIRSDQHSTVSKLFHGRGETFFLIFQGKSREIENESIFHFTMVMEFFISMIYLPCSERTRSERVSTHSSIFPSSSPTSSILFLFPKQKAKRSNLISNRRKKSGWKRIGRDGRREGERETRQGHEVITLSTVFRAPSLSVSVSFHLSVSLTVPSRFLPLRDFACGAGAVDNLEREH